MTHSDMIDLISGYIGELAVVDGGIGGTGKARHIVVEIFDGDTKSIVHLRFALQLDSELLSRRPLQICKRYPTLALDE
jgi:hypothetical protein